MTTHMSKNDYSIPSMRTVIPNYGVFGPVYCKYIAVYTNSNGNPNKLVVVSNSFGVLAQIDNLSTAHVSLYNEIKNLIKLLKLGERMFNVKLVDMINDKYCVMIRDIYKCGSKSSFIKGAGQYRFFYDPANVKKDISNKENKIQEQVNVALKTIPESSRVYRCSDTILQKMRSDKEVDRLVRNICSEIYSGQNMNLRLSTSHNNPSYNDFLFNMTGIHHLHTDMIMKSVRTSKRSNLLLFVYFLGRTAFIIDILPHPNDVKEWKPVHLMNILIKNWPDLLKKYRLDIPAPLSGTIPTDEEVMDATSKGVTALVVLNDGNVYSPPGGGTSTDGTSSRVISISDRIEYQLFDAVRRTIVK